MIRQKRHILYGLSEEKTSTNGLWLLALLYFGSLIAALFLSLIAWKITHALDPDATGYLANKPYPKFFDRSRWFSVLLLLPYLFWQCKVTNFKAVGFSAPFLKTVGKWFLCGIGMIALIYGGTFALGAIEARPESSLATFIYNLDNAILAGIAVGLLEEIVFRGLVFRMFYTAMKPIPAIVASSAFFAVLHFKSSALEFEGLTPDQIGFAEGFAVAIDTAFAIVTQFDFTYLAAIFLVGIVLHQVFLLSDNLWANAALHAGWVFSIKAIGGVFQTSESANLFTGTIRVADGYWVIVVLIAFIALFSVQMKSKDPGTNGNPERT